MRLLQIAASLFAITAAAATVQLEWDRNPETTVAGYRIYFGEESRNYTGIVDTGNEVTGAVTNLVEGRTYYFAATAYDNNGAESAFSEEIWYTIPKATTPPATNAVTLPTIPEDFEIDGVIPIGQ